MSMLDKRNHFLFAFHMVGGNGTIFRGMKDTIGVRSDVDSSWLPIGKGPRDLIARIPPISLNESLANSVMTGTRIRTMEQAGSRFDAAYYFQHTIVSFLYRFRRRVPYLIAMDDTPMWFSRSGISYTRPYRVPGKDSSRWKHVLTRSIYANAFHLLPLSSVVRDSLIEDYGIAAERVTVVPPGIDLARWTWGGPRVQSGATAPFRVLFVGGDFERKGGDLLLELAGMPEFRDDQFHFVTTSFPGTDLPNVFVHSGLAASSTGLIDLYRSADVFVLPTRADTHSIASLEAMAMGLPVISTRVGGVADIILDGETGYYVQPDHLDDLADRLRRLKANRAGRQDMGSAGRRRVETSFNQARHSELIVGLLERAAAERPRERN